MRSDICGLQREGSKFSAITFYLNYTVKIYLSNWQTSLGPYRLP